MSICKNLSMVGLCLAAIASAGPGNYNQQGPKLVGSGFSVALSADGNTALVGGNGVSVFTRNNGVWTQQGGKLVPTDAAPNSNDVAFGFSIALSGDGNTAVIGGRFDNSSVGAVWVFSRSGGTWTQQGSKLVGTGASGAAQQGSSVAVSDDGNTLVEGGPDDNNTSTGALWVFIRTGTVWTQQGSKLSGPAYSGQGSFVAISGDGNTLVESSPLYITEADSAQSDANVFIRSGGAWTLQRNLPLFVGISNSSTTTQYSVLGLTTDGDTLLANGSLFHRKNGTWSQIGSQFTDRKNNGDVYQSYAISRDGSTVVAGGFGSSCPCPGYVDLYVKTGSVWTLQHSYIGSRSIGNSGQGNAVALSANGNSMIEGGPDDDNIGAAWVFAAPELSTSLTHTGNFIRGTTGTYMMTVKNIGDRDIHALPTSVVNVGDQLPSGLTATAMFGIGWNCDITTLTCTRDDGLAVGATFPSVTLVVNVASNAPSTVTNQAIAEGGGSTWGTAKDVTTIQP